MVYAVITPVKTWNGTQMVPSMVTEDINEAKNYARQTKLRLESRRFHHWAKHVRILAPTTPEGYREMSAKVLSYGHDLDFASNGNSIYAQNLIGWGNKLRKLASQAKAK